MIYGQGPPVAKLIDQYGARIATVLLARPVRREINGFEEVYTNLGTDATGQEVTRFEGVRYHTKLIYTSHAQNQADIAQVLRVKRWRGNGRQIAFQPHDDNNSIRAICTATGPAARPWGGRVTEEEIVLELIGTQLFPEEPIPSLDRVGRMIRGRILTTVWQDS